MQGQTRQGGRINGVTRAMCIAGAAALLLAACSPEAGDWRNAQSADSIEAYDAFIAKYPQSEFAAQATERTKQLGEERDWQTASAADTADAYQQFLNTYPEGKWAQEARVRIENFNVMQGDAPETAQAPAPVAPPVAAAPPAAAPAAATPARAAAPAPAAAPAAKPAPVAKPAPSGAGASGSHRVQLGAFSNEVNALAQWKAASDRYAQLKGLSPLVTPTSTGGSRLYRLQAAVRGEAEARALCDALKAGGQPCLYVPPR